MEGKKDGANEEVLSFPSDEAATRFINAYEEENGYRYVIRKSKQRGQTEIQNLQSSKILFESEGRGTVPIPFDGVPFVVISADLLECQYGGNRQKKDVSTFPKDHTYVAGPQKRLLIQPTKKMDCPSKVKIRRIVKFPEYKVDVSSSKFCRTKTANRLRHEFTVETLQEYYVFLQFIGSHSDHVTGKLSNYSSRLDERIIQHIKDLAISGVVNVSDVSRRVYEFAEKIAPPDCSRSNRKYFPSLKDIYNHIYNTVADTSSNKDQVNVQQFVKELQEGATEGDKIFFRPMSEKEELIFVYQTSFQRHLLSKYGQQLCLLDSTYNTTKYTVPVSFVVTPTNFGFQVVACFICGRETTTAIAEALTIIARWNKNWHPANWVTDFDQREISALEQVFPGTCVSLCDFHREQAWRRWLGAKKNGVWQEKDSIIRQDGPQWIDFKQMIQNWLRKIARSQNEECFNTEVDKLRELQIYQNNQSFRNWVEKKWLLESKRWVHCYRSKARNMSVTTTNGVERQHGLLKEKYLREHGFGGSLTSLVTVLIKFFLPDMQEKYIMNNVKCLASSKKYSEDIPEFLKGKPRPFIYHCLCRMPPNVERLEVEKVINVNVDNHKFRVGDKSVEYLDTLPNCNCDDFIRHNMPCKHILAVVDQHPQYGLSCINDNEEEPLFTLDSDAVKNNFQNMDCEMDSINISPSTSNNNIKGCRKCCIETLKNIENNIYGIDNLEILESVMGKLQDLNNHLDSVHPTINSIPKRAEIRKKRLLRGRNVKTQMYKKTYRNRVQKKIRKSSKIHDIPNVDIYPDTEKCDPEKTNPNLNVQPETECEMCDSEKTNPNVNHYTESEKIDSEKTNPNVNLYTETENCDSEKTNPNVNHYTEIEKIDSEKTNPNVNLYTKTENCDSEKTNPNVNHYTESEKIDSEKTNPNVNLYTETENCDSEKTNPNVNLYPEIEKCDIEKTNLNMNLYHGSEKCDREKTNPFVEEVTELWRSKPVMPYPIGKVGPYSLTSESINFLRSTLSDEVIDAYLHLLCHSSRVLHINCVVLTSIFTGAVEIHSLLRRENILEYELCVGAVNQGGNHWILMIIIPSKKRILYIDPLGEREKRQQVMMLRWYEFLHARYKARFDTEMAGRWEIVSPQHALQKDGVSCGVYVLKIAEKYLKGESLKFQWNEQQILAERKNIGARLLESADKKPADMIEHMLSCENDPRTSEITDHPGKRNKPKKRKSSFVYTTPKKRTRRLYCVCKKPNNGRTYWMCEGCKGWFHPNCVGETEEDEPAEYWCPLCTATDLTEEKKEETTAFSDGGNKEVNQFIKQKVINRVFGELKSFLYDILQCDQDFCDESSHQRHHWFIKHTMKFRNFYRKRYLFGATYFDDHTAEKLKTDLTKDYCYTIRDPKFPATGQKIDTIHHASEILNGIFMDDKLVAHFYIQHVLVKEAMAFIVAMTTGMPFEMASEKCIATEVELNIKKLRGK